ncbi:MAG: TonB-dependent receptor, partial [Pseudomonadota bacterium]|nr:TonB-dependent receptor [Pseudomonadota bacterium]
AAGFPICNNNNTSAQFPDGTHHLGATTYHDVRVSWKVPTALNLTVSGGVNNLFDKDPPVCVSCSLNGYDASNYDLPGRFWYVEANLKF